MHLYRPTNLLGALCAASGVQGGTIHQYDLRRVRWVCSERPDSVRNRAGLYELFYTDNDGGEWALAIVGGSSIAQVRACHPIDRFSGVPNVRYYEEPQPYNTIAIATWTRRAAERKTANA